MLGNLTLDGLQHCLYDLQGKVIKDYKNGYCIRFADDLCVSARTKQDAENFLKEIKRFIAKRGLKLSEEKTKIINIKKEGFEFLSRFYLYQDGNLQCVPSNKAVRNFENELEELIEHNKKRWSQRKLIQSVNAKITGFTTYHKFEESKETFKYLDVVVNALLLKFIKEIYPNTPVEQLQKRYWKTDYAGRNIFTLTSNANIHIQNMEDTILVKQQKIDSSKNIFIDKEYFEELDKKHDIDNVVGKYRQVWDRQEGKCYICKKKIDKDHEKTIIHKKNRKNNSISNLAYVHSFCKDAMIQYVQIEDKDLKDINVKEVLKEILPKGIRKRKESKFAKLTEYFHNLKKNKVTLRFKDIEKIIRV